jgi:hypothetical protein
LVLDLVMPCSKERPWGKLLRIRTDEMLIST